jgi:hypothetical protein
MIMRQFAVRLALIVATLAIATAGCGASSDGADATAATTTSADVGTDDTQPSSAQAEGTETTTPTPSSDQPETMTLGDYEFPVLGSATVTIDGTTYDFNLLECAMFEDRFDGAGYSTADSPDLMDYVQFYIQPPGSPDIAQTARHSIRVVDPSNNFEWNAGAGPFLGPITFEHSRILDWTRDGMTASGSALFVETNEAYSQDANADYPEPAPVNGTFEIDCS